MIRSIFRPVLRPWGLLLVTIAVCIGLHVRASAAMQDAGQGPVVLRILIVASESEAQRVLARAKAGEDFATLAREHSVDPSAPDGGLLGSIDPAQLRPELRDALRGVRPGQVTSVVAVPAGFALVQVVSHGAAVGARPDPTNPGLTASGSVKYVLNISGFGEVLTGQDALPKPDGWNTLPGSICQARRDAVDSLTRRYEQLLGPGGAAVTMPPPRVLQLHFGLGQTYAYSGRMDAVIDQFSKALALVVTHASPSDPTAVQLEEALGIAWLRKAEMDNSVQEHADDRCLLTPLGLAPYADTTASRKAIEHFLRYLSHRPDELEVKWMLNIAYMTVGGYPKEVPPAHLIPPSTFESAEDLGRFTDVARDVGLHSVATSGSSLVDDFDNDGLLDFITSSSDPCAQMKSFRRLPDGTFADVTAASGLTGQLGGLNAVHADYDNDGCVDILVLRGGWDRPQRKSLLRNDCKGGFADVTVAAGLDGPITATQAAVWTDIDNDGLLDIFVGQEGGEAQLHLNQGDGTFREIGKAAGLTHVAFTKGVVAFDYDNDGWQDLYASNLTGESFLYRNNRDRTFTEVALAAGVPGSLKAFASWAFDYDNDGWQDLFVTSYYTSVVESARTYLGLPPNGTTLKLYRNKGDGTFADVSMAVGLGKVFMPMGANFGDIDNDGWLDIYLGTGNPSYGALTPSSLLRNKDGTRFVDVTFSSGTGELHKGHGVSFADLDNDGDQDIVFEVGGAVPGDSHAVRLFRNPGHGNDWLALKLVGVKSNRSAIGARIAVTAEGPAGQRVMHRTVTTGGSFGGSPLLQHIGLGKADRVVRVDVWWPSTNTRQRFTNLTANQTFEITEFEPVAKPLARAVLPLGKVTSRAATHAH
ncbi:MAG: VCBS repeat-containing protein [Acidobacteria bacterium]|nr:VCBS repeat-containing protein [Acidobacteriota bacterium]